MLRSYAKKFAAFLADLLYRHTVALEFSHERYREAYSWIEEHIGKRYVWVKFNYTVLADEDGTITSIIDKKRIEFRFIRVTDAVMFKLMFSDYLFKEPAR